MHDWRPAQVGGADAAFVASASFVDDDTLRAITIFQKQITSRYPLISVILYGSRARGVHRPDSDIDLAVILRGNVNDRFGIATDMARMAFHVMMETGLMIEAFPLAQAEYDNPATFPNPRLVEAIRRDGIKFDA